MGQKQIATQVSAFDPTSMGAYRGMQSGIADTIGDFMRDPRQAGFLNLLLQQGLGGARQLGGRNISNMLQNMVAGGFGGSNIAGFQAEQLAKGGRATSGLESNAFIQNLLMSPQLRMAAAQLGAGYRPLQTGGKETRQISGLGAWLPQVAGMALGSLMGGFASRKGGEGGGFGNIVMPDMSGLNQPGSPFQPSFPTSMPVFMGAQSPLMGGR